MPRVEKFEIYAVDLPFRKPFKHAAAERRSSDSLFVKCITDSGAVGFGECLPREYVTGESRDGAFDLLSESILPRLIGMEYESIDAVRSFLAECDGKAPPDWVESHTPQTAAWCAVDLALLDAFGRAFGQPIRLGDDASWPKSLRYSVVISSDSGLKKLLLIRLLGVRQVKLKVEAGDEIASARRVRRCLGRRCDIRVDANMAWDAEAALAAMRQMSEVGITSFEQPVAADDIDGLARLVRESDLGVMVDESLSDRDSLANLVERNACTAVNVRVSKCGGLLAAHARCREALDAGLTVQIGCQVGESSLLSAAHLILVSAVRDVRYAEGCFGHLLLREDPAEPVLQFGFGGKPPKMPPGPGLGVSINEETLARWTAKQQAISR